MKEIGIADFEQLVMERLTKPRKFAGRSLVLWNADGHPHGIAQRVIGQCCEKYEKEHPNDQVWFYWSSFEFIDDDYTKTTVLKDKMVKDENHEGYHSVFEKKRCGLIFNSGDYIPQEQNDWLKLVNTHRNRRGGVSPDCPMIFCASGNAFKEKQFGSNCDIYAIRPTEKEWIPWVKQFYSSEIFEVVCAYIEKYGANKGCQYWMLIMDELEHLKIYYSLLEKKDCSLWQIPEYKVNFKIRGMAPDFCKFIHSYFEGNSQKE